jgi:hypothetical protein
MLSLNPSIKNQVEVIKESEPIFLYGIGAFHKKASKELISGFEKQLIKNDSYTHEYTQLFKILDDVKIKKLDLKDLVKLDKFYDEYIRLKNLNFN